VTGKRLRIAAALAAERRLRITAALVAALALAWILRTALAGGAADGGRPAPGAEPPPLRAELYVVAPSRVRDVVRTGGSLAANESVDVVPELSRRLVAAPVAEGTSVEKGALLFKLDDADLRAQLAELEARRRLAARTEGRQRKLLEYDRKALSQQAYDQAVSELEAVEAEIAALRVTLAKTEIRAPFPARVGLRRASEGAWVTPETKLTTLQDTSRIKVDFTLPERHAGAVSVGQPFRFRIAGRGDSLEGRVLAIEPAIDAGTRSLLVRGVYENPDGALMPGAFATVELPVEQADAGILVPAEAIVPSVSGHAVYVLRDGRAELQPVEIGLRTPDSVQVLQGLAVGDTVVTSNLLRLRPGARVERAEGAEGVAQDAKGAG
jgi:membrane fusion protein (multidrug efflux system)